MEEDFKELEEDAEILKALAHPVRLCIVKGLWRRGSCNVSHMQYCLQVPQSTLSQHLQKLKSAGLIKGVRNGVEIQYTLCHPKTVRILQALFKESSSEPFGKESS